MSLRYLRVPRSDLNNIGKISISDDAALDESLEGSDAFPWSRRAWLGDRLA
jgi:hypothetical protein